MRIVDKRVPPAPEITVGIENLKPGVYSFIGPISGRYHTMFVTRKVDTDDRFHLYKGTFFMDEFGKSFVPTSIGYGDWTKVKFTKLTDKFTIVIGE